MGRAARCRFEFKRVNYFYCFLNAFIDFSKHTAVRSITIPFASRFPSARTSRGNGPIYVGPESQRFICTRLDANRRNVDRSEVESVLSTFMSSGSSNISSRFEASFSQLKRSETTGTPASINGDVELWADVKYMLSDGMVSRGRASKIWTRE